MLTLIMNTQIFHLIKYDLGLRSYGELLSLFLIEFLIVYGNINIYLIFNKITL